MPRQYNRLRQTRFDLYIERDALPWYIKAVAIFASWLTLGGYILFALVFTSAESNLKPSRFTLTLLASIFLLVGYGVSAATAIYSRSLLFAFDAVLLPALTSSAMGVFVTVMNYAQHHDFPVPSHTYIYVPLGVASTTTVASAILCYITYRRLAKVKSLDNQRRQRGQRWDRASSASYGDATSTTELLPMHNDGLPEDEAQRRQFLRLLLDKDSRRSPNSQGPSNTYQITLPGENGDPPRLQVVTPDGRQRSGSLPDNPSKWNVLHKFARDPSPTLEGSRDPRERRRQQIERTSVLLAPGF
ncbi:hypothetical protein A1O1_00203 [Capronia coronata CBS 617.96]|uniref:Uncharacterized protein n=1 Tax=Capronia coronata CBS 617.96 TaxID=1182541 RepID=W9YZG7_9EURO|nr:uncharacterized protein A1O1_00203 [Capronia coronata CBS 617.96]EXJ95085.1 hypothetical protein A1O1_00203 [Capronia coronata CBS 617.96]